MAASSSLAEAFLPPAAKAPLEPKLIFASERTFLHWTHVCVTMAASGMVITSSSGGSTVQLVIGGVLSVYAVCLIWYAFFKHAWRMDRITARDCEQYDDPVGPLVLAISVLVVLLAAAGAVARDKLM